MSDATEYSEEQFIGRTFEGSDADPAPSTVYLALWTTAPANDPDPSNEVDGNQYSPIGVDNADWNRVTTGGPTAVQNDIEIDYGVLDDTDPTDIEGVVVLDGPDATSANALYANDDVSETIVAGNEFRIHAGDASFVID